MTSTTIPLRTPNGLHAAASTTCTIGIAGMAVALRGAETPLIAGLRRKYAAFTSDDDPQLIIDIVLGEPETGAPELVVAGPLARFYEPGFAGRIDLDRRTGSVHALRHMAGPAVEHTLRIAYALLAFEAGGLMIHGAGIARGERGYLFLGPSGAGKTTVARNSPGARVLNDDLVLVLPGEGAWTLHATPFTNPTQVAPSGPGTAALEAIYRLVQAPEVAVKRLGIAVATAEFLAGALIVNLDRDRHQAFLRRALSITQRTPAALLHCLPTPSFWEAIEPVANERIAI